MIWVIFWNISIFGDMFSLFQLKTIKSNFCIIFLKFFPIIISWWNLFSFPVMFIYNTVNFCHPSMIFFLFLHELTRLLQYIENICYFFYWWDLLLHFLFLSNQENLYMTHHDSDLINDIYNTINQHNQRQTHYLSYILNYFDIYF